MAKKNNPEPEVGHTHGLHKIECVIFCVVTAFALVLSFVGQKTTLLKQSRLVAAPARVLEVASPQAPVTELNIRSMATTDAEMLYDLGSRLARQAVYDFPNPEEFVAQVFPSATELLAMLARDRDVDDYLENASDDNASGTYYTAIAELVPLLKPLRSKFEAVYDGAYAAFTRLGRTLVPSQTAGEARLYRGGVTLPGLSSPPREVDYDYSHTYALDIFFEKVRRVPLTTLEVGPTIFSLSDGIVVATDSSWQGGEDLESYRGGGITPKAGNGVIVYSPSGKRYYSYFHLHDVLVEPGNVIRTGQPLGHGGNTGANARKPGHGGHVHLEIYDVATERFLRNRQIAALVF